MATGSTPDKSADEKTLTISSDLGTVPFFYPDAGNMGAHVRAILTGATYPWPATPVGYAFDTIVDIGANVGASALWFGARKPRRLVCFEPAEANVALLRRNLAALSGVEINSFGLFGYDREVRLFHGRNQNMQHSVVPSIETGDESETIALRRASSVFAELEISAISLLKLDTEGCEVPILRDMAGMLPRIDMIFVEYHSERDRKEIDSMLTPLFVLSFADSRHPHRGVNLYVANRIVEAVPIYTAMALDRPT